MKRNILANYASQIYVALIGIFLLPLYIKYMGSEAYGLVGFFSMLQAWFNVLDLGLTPTIARETARYHGGALLPLAYRQLFRALSVIFFAVALLGGTVLLILSEQISIAWLNVENLSLKDVVTSVKIMAISVALRWMCGLYRGVVTGSERLVWLSGVNALIATLRFVGVFISMWHFGFTPIVFFIHQLCVAIFEIGVLAIKAMQLLPDRKSLQNEIGWSITPVKSVLKFSMTIAFTASVWVLVTQTDKLVLSGILPLEDYGYFTLSVLVANGLMVISGPVSNAIMPRMARLYAEKKYADMIRIYRHSTQLVAIITGSAAITLAATAKPLLLAWTGDAYLAGKAAPILRLYAVGNLFLCMAAFSYYLQYAKGNLRYHLIGNAGLVITLIPCIVVFASHYGGVGAGTVWMIMNALFLFVWVAFVHHKLEPRLHLKWLCSDVFKNLFPAVIVAILFLNIDINLVGRLENALFVAAVGIMGIICAIFSSTQARLMLKNKIRNKIYLRNLNGE